MAYSTLHEISFRTSGLSSLYVLWFSLTLRLCIYNVYCIANTLYAHYTHSMQRTCFLYIVYTLYIQIVSYTLINIKCVYKINVFMYVVHCSLYVQHIHYNCVFTLAGPAHLARIRKIMTM